MNCCGIPFNVCYSLLLMAFLMFPSRLGRLFLDGTVSLLPACVGSTPRVGDYCVLLRLESPGKTHLFVLQQGRYPGALSSHKKLGYSLSGRSTSGCSHNGSWSRVFPGDTFVSFPALGSVWCDCEMVWTACRYFFLKDYKRTNVIFIVPWSFILLLMRVPILTVSSLSITEPEKSLSVWRNAMVRFLTQMMKSNAVRAAWRWDSITIRCNDHLCVQGIRLVLYAIRYESSNRKNFLWWKTASKRKKEPYKSRFSDG